MSDDYNHNSNPQLSHAYSADDMKATSNQPVSNQKSGVCVEVEVEVKSDNKTWRHFCFRCGIEHRNSSNIVLLALLALLSLPPSPESIFPIAPRLVSEVKAFLTKLVLPKISSGTPDQNNELPYSSNH